MKVKNTPFAKFSDVQVGTLFLSPVFRQESQENLIVYGIKVVQTQDNDPAFPVMLATVSRKENKTIRVAQIPDEARQPGDIYTGTYVRIDPEWRFDPIFDDTLVESWTSNTSIPPLPGQGVVNDQGAWVATQHGNAINISTGELIRVAATKPGLIFRKWQVTELQEGGHRTVLFHWPLNS